MLHGATTESSITTGIKEISQVLGGGIRPGSLVMIEGETKTGKSVLSQHLAHGTLCAKEYAVAYYTAELNLQDMIRQMASMSLDITHEVGTDRMRIYSVGLENPKDAPAYLKILADHFRGLPERFKLLILDSLTPLIRESNHTDNMDFLHNCKEICKTGRTIILVFGTHVFEARTLTRAYAISDYYLKLTTKDPMIGAGQVDEREIKIMDVTKLCGAERHGHDGLDFEIKPRVGIVILPFVNVRI